MRPGFAALRRFARRPGDPGPRATAPQGGATPHASAACEVCAAPLEDDHGHLLDVSERALRCACRACALLFERPGAGGMRYRAVSRRWRSLPPAPDGAWSVSRIPVGLAFFVTDSRTGGVHAFYPGPAGVIESTLEPAAWGGLVEAHPGGDEAEPDVEALLVHRGRGGSTEAFLVPVDACYALAATLRRAWKGFDGGEPGRTALDGFLADVRRRCAEAEPGAGS